ncbi:EamA family transporter [Aquibacillus halophilus]|uniref:EamA family transporter n=1 Tax=Aquibacillus halophilus TaxID=930132 RepID=A0A6A8DIF6_9BACI|nr:DMT family transporter [Aquibacillus halophilus]MRH45040.1 EamA family transporter [Aquibacillus halophilus]
MNNLLLILLSLLWGSAFLWTKLLLEQLHPISLVFFRCLFGLLFIIPFLIKLKISIKRPITFKFVGVMSLGAAIPWLMVSFALLSLHTSVSGVMNSFAAIFTFILTILIYRVRPLVTQIISLLLGFFAVIILFLESLFSADFSPIGILLMLSVTLCYGSNSVLTSRYFRNLSPFVLGFYTLLIAVILNGVGMLIVEPGVVLKIIEPTIFFPLLILGGFSSGLGYVIFYRLVSSGGAVFGSFVTFLIPFVSVLLGVLVLNEPFSFTFLIGFVLVLCSLVFMNWQVLMKIKANRLKSIDKSMEKSS